MARSRPEFPNFELFHGRYSARFDGKLIVQGLSWKDLEQLNNQYGPDALVKDIIIDKLRGGGKNLLKTKLESSYLERALVLTSK
ncbi:MAG: hypothetical protein A2W22_01555 [Candidatus Levybacteria bacterium RBG_16_35_11]|nr:MAG: hypothetical protein A2W22_01555 [Candidatus Levybacteria bacterium RBG_16_35_11]